MKRKDKIYKATGLCLVLLLMLSTVPAESGQGTQGSTTTQSIEVEDYEIACPMDAKECPDGSYVGRVPPDCEFAPCPEDGTSFYVYTNKGEYTVGEMARVTVVLSGQNIGGADVWANVEYPDGTTERVRLDATACTSPSQPGPGYEGPYGYMECIYSGNVYVSQAGTYYLTAYADGDDFEVKAETKFLAYHGAEPEVRFSVRMDKDEYEVGEDAKIIASLSGYQYQGIEDADVWATVEYPSGVAQRIKLEATLCAMAQGGSSFSCMYEGSVHIGQEGTHYVTAYAEGETFEIKDHTKFYAYSGTHPEVRFSVYTDKDEYRLGEKARITASLSGYHYQGIEDADVWATVEYPNGVSEKVKLRGTVCAASACACTEGEICECPPTTVSCQFENRINVNQEGAHYIIAYAEGDEFEKRAETKFWAYDVSEVKYVRLNQKFELDVEESAVVTDYREMRLTLDNIIYPKCAVLEDAGSGTSSSAVKCLDARGYALVTVRVSVLSAGVAAADLAPTEDGYYTETQVRIEEGGSASLYGAEISLLELDDDEAVFVVSKEGNGDYVDVKVEPSRQSVELGEMAEYEIIVRDNHPVPLYRAVDESGMPYRYYTYRIKVYDLPFNLEYDAWVEVGVGREVSTPLRIYTSPYGVVETEESLVGDTGSGAVQAQAVLLRAMNNTVSAEAAMERVKVAPDIIASGRAYKFRVDVFGEDNSQDTASALLNVLYSPPPPPPSDEVEIELSQGWNLIALPGEGELSQGTCSGMDELHAFVYLKSEERYVTILEAARIMGERRLKEYLKTHSFWVYSYRNCAMIFRLDEPTSLHDISLEDGWNFVPVTQDMEGNSLSDIGGDCDFEKTYYWDSREQSWERMSLSQRFDDDMLYNGFVANVDDDCDFGWGAIITPPPLPA